MSKICKYGVKFFLEEGVNENEFNEVLNSLEFNAVFRLIEKEIAKYKEKSLYFTAEAGRAAEYGEWNHKSSSEWMELSQSRLDKIPQLLVWEVKNGFTDTDKNGNSYSQLRYDGLKVTNSLLNVAYNFK